MQSDVSSNKFIIDRLHNTEITEAQSIVYESNCEQAMGFFLMVNTVGANTGNISYSLKLFLDDGLLDTITGTISASTGTDNPTSIEKIEENVVDAIKNASRYELTLSFLHSSDYTPTITLGKIFHPEGAVSGYNNGDVIDANTLASLVAGVIDPTTEGNAGEIKFIAVDPLGRIKTASFDEIWKAIRIVVLNQDHMVKLPLPNFINATNLGIGTHRYILNFKPYDNATVGLILAGGLTGSIYGTNNPDADDTADTGWILLSSDTVVDTTGGWNLTGQSPWDRIMIKLESSDGSNTAVADITTGG